MGVWSRFDNNLNLVLRRDDRISFVFNGIHLWITELEGW